MGSNSHINRLLNAKYANYVVYDESGSTSFGFISSQLIYCFSPLPFRYVCLCRTIWPPQKYHFVPHERVRMNENECWKHLNTLHLISSHLNRKISTAIHHQIFQIDFIAIISIPYYRRYHFVSRPMMIRIQMDFIVEIVLNTIRINLCMFSEAMATARLCFNILRPVKFVFRLLESIHHLKLANAKTEISAATWIE